MHSTDRGPPRPKSLKELCVRVHHDGNLDPITLLKNLWKSLSKDSVDTCRTVTRTCYEVTVVNVDILERLTASSEWSVDGNMVKVERMYHATTTVYVKGLPAHVENAQIGAMLSVFQVIRSVDQEYFKEEPFSNVRTGIRIVKLNMKKPVLNFVRVGNNTAACWYAGMRKVCRRCEKEGHFAEDCAVKLCFNCKKADHTEAECKECCFRCSAAEP